MISRLWLFEAFWLAAASQQYALNANVESLVDPRDSGAQEHPKLQAADVDVPAAPADRDLVLEPEFPQGNSFLNRDDVIERSALKSEDLLEAVSVLPENIDKLILDADGIIVKPQVAQGGSFIDPDNALIGLPLQLRAAQRVSAPDGMMGEPLFKPELAKRDSPVDVDNAPMDSPLRPAIDPNDFSLNRDDVAGKAAWTPKVMPEDSLPDLKLAGLASLPKPEPIGKDLSLEFVGGAPVKAGVPFVAPLEAGGDLLLGLAATRGAPSLSDHGVGQISLEIPNVIQKNPLLDSNVEEGYVAVAESQDMKPEALDNIEQAMRPDPLIQDALNKIEPLGESPVEEKKIPFNDQLPGGDFKDPLSKDSDLKEAEGFNTIQAVAIEGSADDDESDESNPDLNDQSLLKINETDPNEPGIHQLIARLDRNGLPIQALKSGNDLGRIPEGGPYKAYPYQANIAHPHGGNFLEDARPAELGELIGINAPGLLPRRSHVQAGMERSPLGDFGTESAAFLSGSAEVSLMPAVEPIIKNFPEGPNEALQIIDARFDKAIQLDQADQALNPKSPGDSMYEGIYAANNAYLQPTGDPLSNGFPAIPRNEMVPGIDQNGDIILPDGNGPVGAMPPGKKPLDVGGMDLLGLEHEDVGPANPIDEMPEGIAGVPVPVVPGKGFEQDSMQVLAMGLAANVDAKNSASYVVPSGHSVVADFLFPLLVVLTFCCIAIACVRIRRRRSPASPPYGGHGGFYSARERPSILGRTLGKWMTSSGSRQYVPVV